MTHRFLISIGALIALPVIALGTMPMAAQTPASTAKPGRPAKAYAPPRTPDGRPDLQGVWDYRTITPLERPTALGERQFFTDEEAAKFEADENRRQNRDLIDPAKGGVQYPPGGVVPYNEFWYDRGDKVTASRRTSLIVDPPDGRLPPRTADGQRRAEIRAAAQREDQFGRPKADSYEDRPLPERCILGFNAGPPMLPGAYNNNFQLFQSAGYVVIHTEMVHDARLVPLDGRPHGNIRQWLGDSRGRWEGDTLVVDTTNFRRETSLAGSSANMHLVERFTRVDADTLLYEFTVNDPSTWTKPWTAQLSMKKSQEPMYEYACHEGNYGMMNMLAGARVQEKAAEEARKKGLR